MPAYDDSIIKRNLLEEKEIRHQRELEEDRARDQALLDNIGDGIIGVDDRGNIIYTNKQVEILTGFLQKELIGKFILHALKAVDDNGNEVASDRRPIRNALINNKKIQADDFSYVRKDGSTFPVNVTATPILVNNRIIGGVIVIRDITKIREVDRMKNEFISLASHQLRTPLSAIKWFCEILLAEDAGQLSSEQKELLTNVYLSNERMIDLVNMLLNISRIEAGKTVLDIQGVEIRKFIEEIKADLTQKINDKNINFKIHIADNITKVSFDEKLIRQVYMNLLTNAIKYSKDKGLVTLDITIEGNYYITKISDNGFGIPAKEQEKVFSKFFRGENIVRVETEGTGLGLYLSKMIVELSGGNIWFESNENKGTIFYFKLPTTVES